MGILLGEIGKERGIAPQEAFRSFGRRNVLMDAAILLPFLANLVTCRQLLRYPPEDSGATSSLMLAFASLVLAALGLFLASEWSMIAESIRIGTTHLSNRALRLPVTQNPVWTYAIAVALFWAVARVRSRIGRRLRPVGELLSSE